MAHRNRTQKIQHILDVLLAQPEFLRLSLRHGLVLQHERYRQVDLNLGPSTSAGSTKRTIVSRMFEMKDADAEL